MGIGTHRGYSPTNYFEIISSNEFKPITPLITNIISNTESYFEHYNDKQELLKKIMTIGGRPGVRMSDQDIHYLLKKVRNEITKNAAAFNAVIPPPLPPAVSKSNQAAPVVQKEPTTCSPTPPPIPSMTFPGYVKP